MATQLSLFEANLGTFEATTSTKASKHHLELEPGDPLVITYKLKKRGVDGSLTRWDSTPYTIVASAYNPVQNTTVTFTNAKGSTLADAIKDILTVTITAAQSTQIGINDDFTWGIRFTETAVPTNTFTFLSGNITAKEDTVV